MNTQQLSTKLRGWLPLLPVLLLLLASYWLSLQVAPLTPVERIQRHDVDFVIDKLSSTTLNDQGQPRFALSAEKMWHYPDDETTHLQMPVLTSFLADRPPSHTSAQSGTINNHNTDVRLYDEVQVVRPAGGNLVEQRFQTDFLHVMPERDFAQTDHPVMMVSGKNSISALGMEIDNQARTVKLLSQVKAIHEPIRK
ncbi:MAG: LPS export ABC transporter periplasmic protein LptC [Sideroxydans sp.]|nr:LPS export ABC transporter periplasmic protein LptC [Sideroxydans sp.]